ncbi:porin family protein [Salipiger aestuarii]|uniref:hypothetical protein n=1 Tax=Salipiger aestuarii TaxID=568098 RepID=UPI00123A59F1|nr:hypothetical protein [Salipiger aestuarii]
MRPLIHRKTILAVAGLCALMGAGAAVLADENVALGADALRVRALQAYGAGRPDVALSWAQALVKRDSTDFDAQLLRARAARDLSDWTEARAGAAALRGLAVTDDQSFAAAMISAQVASSQGHHGIAQLRLRQAIQVSPDETLRKIAERDFLYVRARNPWAADLSFSVSPASNVNNGSRQATGTFDLPYFGVVEAELQGSAQALSGTEFAKSLGLRYRLHEDARHRQTDVMLALSHSGFVLSDDARDKAPDAEGADFAFGVAQLSLAHRGVAGDAKRPFQLAVSLGKTWYGAEEYTGFTDVSAAQSWTLGGAKAVVISAGVRGETALDPRTADSESWRLGAGWRQAVGEAGHRLGLDLTRSDRSSDRASLDYGSWTAGARVALGQPVLGLGLEFAVTAGTRDYARGPVAGQGRLDTTLGAQVTAEFKQLDYYGFVPTLTVQGERTESDYGQYDAEEFGLKLGLRSAF